jgi:hypothetical protein
MTTETATSYIFYILLVLYPFFPLIKEKYSSMGNMIELILILLLFTGTIIYSEQRKLKARIAVNVVPILMMTAIYAIFTSTDYYDSLSAFRMYLLYIAVLHLFIARADIIDNTKVINISMVMCTIMGVGALIQFIYPTFIKYLHTAESLIQLRYKSDFTAFSTYNRAISFMLDPNILSIYLCFNVMAFIQYFRGREKSKLFIISMVTSLCGCALTQSRTGMFVIAAYVLINLLRWIITRHRINLIGYLIFIACIIAIIFFFAFHFNFFLQFIRVNTLFTANGRVTNNQVMLNTLTQQNLLHLFFGNGLTVGRNVVFENSYLLCLYTFGIVGSIIFIIFSSYAIKPFANHNNWIAILCYLLVNLVGDYLLIPQVTLYLLLELGVSSNSEGV